MVDERYYRKPSWWRSCEKALQDYEKNKRMIRDIESVYTMPGRELQAVRIMGGESDGLANTIDRMMADRYLSRLKLEAAAIEETNTDILTAYGPEDGRRRLDAIVMLYTEHTHTIEGVSKCLHISIRTAHYYRADYMRTLARRLGYENGKRGKQ